MSRRALGALLLAAGLAACRRATPPPVINKDQEDFVRVMRAGQTAAVEAMLAKGFPVNAPIPVVASKGVLRMTPLMLAALDGQVAMAKLLLARGADLRAKDEHGWTALFFVQSAPTDEIGLAMTEYLVDAGLPAGETDDKNATPLLYAVAANNLQQAQYLLLHGADPNLRAADGDCPLFHAVLEGNLPMIETLVNFHADVNARQPDGGTVLLALPELGLSFDAEQRIAAYLLQHGGDPNMLDHSGFSPLLNALRNKDTDLAKLLLRFNADPNLGGKKKSLNALMLCVDTHNYEMARVLMAHHADPSLTLGADGPSAYSLAQQQGDDKMLAVLGGR